MKPAHYINKYLRDIKPRLTSKSVAPNRIKLNANENTYPLPTKFIEEITHCVKETNRNYYPSQDLTRYKQGLAHLYGCESSQVFIDNGSSVVLERIWRAVLQPGQTVAGVVPSFILYPHLCQLTQTTFIEIAYPDDFAFPVEELLETQADLYIIANPNNPTGTTLSPQQIEHILQSTNSLVIVDEAYIEFGGESVVPLIKLYPNLIVIRTLSKAFGLAGVRIGVAIGHLDIIEHLDYLQPAFHINAFDQQVIISALKYHDLFAQIITKIKLTKTWVEKELSSLGFTMTESATNFVFLTGSKDNNISFQDLRTYLQTQHIAIMYYPNPVYNKEYLRITIGTEEEMHMVIQEIQTYLT